MTQNLTLTGRIAGCDYVSGGRADLLRSDKSILAAESFNMSDIHSYFDKKLDKIGFAAYL